MQLTVVGWCHIQGNALSWAGFLTFEHIVNLTHFYSSIQSFRAEFYIPDFEYYFAVSKC